MASEKGIKTDPPILAEIKKRAYPILETRPPDSLSMKEMATAAGVSVDVIRRQLQEMRATCALEMRPALHVPQLVAP